MTYPTIEIALPEWIDAMLPDANQVYPRIEDRMELVGALAHQNVKGGTGYPVPSPALCVWGPWCGGVVRGVVVWSGVRRLVCGARDSDACAVGFDEGPKPDDWISALKARGISVLRDVGRAASIRAPGNYAAQGGVIYNARQGAFSAE